MAFNIVEGVFDANPEKTVTLTGEQIEKVCTMVIKVMNTMLPEEAHSVEVFDYILERVKGAVHSMPVKLQ